MYGKYNRIRDNLKEEFFKEVQGVFENFINKYGLYEDIVNNVDVKILNEFKINEIVEEGYNQN